MLVITTKIRTNSLTTALQFTAIEVISSLKMPGVPIKVIIVKAVTVVRLYFRKFHNLVVNYLDFASTSFTAAIVATFIIPFTFIFTFVFNIVNRIIRVSSAFGFILVSLS